MNGYTRKRSYKQRPKAGKRNSNLGKELEGFIEAANEMYFVRGQAVIQKQHIEIVIQQMQPNGKGQVKITEGYIKEQGAPDYMGIVNGRGICFDAKETTSNTSFPIKQVKDSQVDYLRRYKDSGGFSFLIVRFVKKGETYILPIDDFVKWWKDSKGEGRKSIPYEYFFMECEMIPVAGVSPCDYLPVLRKKFI